MVTGIQSQAACSIAGGLDHEPGASRMDRVNAPDLPRRPFPPACLAALRQLLGERVSTGESVRAQHGRDESSFPPAPPDAVVFPRSTDEVVAIVKACAAHDVPMI